jgi:hypothetical protein
MVSSSPSDSDLKAILLVQPNARTFGSGVPFSLPDSPTWRERWAEIPPSRPLSEGELLEQWVSPAWRASDVPLTFHSDQTPLSTRSMMSMMDWVNEEGAILQYLFADGLCLTAGELLRHSRGRQVPRLLLPLALQIRPEVQGASLAHRPHNMRPQWLIHSDQVVATVLLATERVNRGLMADEDGTPIQLLFTTSADKNSLRKAIRFEGVSVEQNDASAGGIEWVVQSIEESEYALRGAVNIKASSSGVPDAAETYRFDGNSHHLVFHSWRDRLDGVRAFLSSNLGPEASGQNGRLEIKGHGQIQALIEEIENRKSAEESEAKDRVVVQPKSVIVEPPDLETHLAVTTDGSFRIKFSLGAELSGQELEAHGFPQALKYVIYLLQG